MRHSPNWGDLNVRFGPWPLDRCHCGQMTRHTLRSPTGESTFPLDKLQRTFAPTRLIIAHSAYVWSLARI